jgi:hypothetical protein
MVVKTSAKRMEFWDRHPAVKSALIILGVLGLASSLGGVVTADAGHNTGGPVLANGHANGDVPVLVQSFGGVDSLSRGGPTTVFCALDRLTNLPQVSQAEIIMGGETKTVTLHAGQQAEFKTWVAEGGEASFAVSHWIRTGTLKSEGKGFTVRSIGKGGLCTLIPDREYRFPDGDISLGSARSGSKLSVVSGGDSGGPENFDSVMVYSSLAAGDDEAALRALAAQTVAMGNQAFLDSQVLTPTVSERLTFLGLSSLAEPQPLDWGSFIWQFINDPESQAIRTKYGGDGQYYIVGDPLFQYGGVAPIRNQVDPTEARMRVGALLLGIEENLITTQFAKMHEGLHALFGIGHNNPPDSGAIYPFAYGFTYEQPNPITPGFLGVPGRNCQTYCYPSWYLSRNGGIDQFGNPMGDASSDGVTAVELFAADHLVSRLTDQTIPPEAFYVVAQTQANGVITDAVEVFNPALPDLSVVSRNAPGIGHGFAPNLWVVDGGVLTGEVFLPENKVCIGTTGVITLGTVQPVVVNVPTNDESCYTLVGGGGYSVYLPFIK